MEKYFFKGIKKAARMIIILLMLLLVISLMLGSVDLILEVYNRIASPDPYPFVIKTEDLYEIFSVLLIIIVGYELFGSMHLILNSEEIPVKPIIKVAAIAMANKIITLNIKDVNWNELLGIAALFIAIGVTYYFFNKDSRVND